MCGDDSDLLPKVKVAKRVAVAALVFAILTIVDWAVVAGYSGSPTARPRCERKSVRNSIRIWRRKL